MQGTTKSGFKFNVPKERIDDINFLRTVKAMESDVSKVLDLVEMILQDDEERFYKHLQQDDGRVPISIVQKEISEILNILGKTKAGKK